MAKGAMGQREKNVTHTHNATAQQIILLRTHGAQPPMQVFVD